MDSVENKVVNPAPAEPEAIAQLKTEFSKQFEEFKLAVKKDMEAKDKVIEDQKKQIDALNSEIVRTATMTPPAEERKKTPEELYQEEVDKNVEYCKKLLTENTFG